MFVLYVRQYIYEIKMDPLDFIKYNSGLVSLCMIFQWKFLIIFWNNFLAKSTDASSFQPCSDTWTYNI